LKNFQNIPNLSKTISKDIVKNILLHLQAEWAEKEQKSNL